MVSNILLNLGIVYMSWRLATKYFSRRTAYIFVVLYCMLYSTWWIAIPTGTEQPFLFLALTGLCLLHKRGAWLALAAGICFAVANWIRPTAAIFLAAAVVAMWRRKAWWAEYATLTAATLATILVIGFACKRQMGDFLYQSVTTGVNLVQTANDHTYGGVTPPAGFFDPTNQCYIENAEQLTYKEKDSIWKSRALDWIAEHPARYAGLYLWKLPATFLADDWPENAVHGAKPNLSKLFEGRLTTAELWSRIADALIHGVVYYSVMLIFLIGLWQRRKDIMTQKGLILLFVAVSLASTCIFPYHQRYHYPFLFAMVIWAAYTIETWLNKRKIHCV